MSVVCKAPKVSGAVRIKLVSSAREREAARALRRAVFCEEQRIFEQDDTDDIDVLALPIVAVLSISGMPDEVVGTVRIHESARGVWYGSRLAVVRHMRGSAAIGSGLIRLAVGAAHAHGCKTFLAHVQQQNVALFTSLHWTSLSEIELHGRLHHLMQADLAHYPPIVDGDTGFVATKGAA
jgi:putative N-acetyltransferase (TIGR04045 family)